MIERRDAEEGVVLLLSVVVLLHDSSVGDPAVFVQDRLGEACCARGKIDCAVIVFRDLYARCFAGVVHCL